jgi:hypothetical protein
MGGYTKLHRYIIYIDVVAEKFGSTCQTVYSLMPTPVSKVTVALSARAGRGQ